MRVRVIGKVAGACQAGRERERRFKKLGALPYDSRILSWRKVEREISIGTLGGRQGMRDQCGERQAEMLAKERGETDLAYIGGEFYLLTPCEVEEAEEKEVAEYPGVDLGSVNLATDSDGHV
jgi:putative transposase